jgi:hypothetical protein
MENLDLVIDLNTMDDSGLPWAFLDAAVDRTRIVPGNHIIVGSGQVRAVAVVVDIDGDVVHVRPLRGPVSRHRHLLGGQAAS